MSEMVVRLLFVDELADERLMYGMGLQLVGFDVCMVASVPEALTQADTFRPHAIVVHLGTGRWDLCDAFGQCRATSDVPIVVITADVRPDRVNRDRARTTPNCAAFIGKPCTHEDIAVVVRRVIAGERHIEFPSGPSNYGGYR